MEKVDMKSEEMQNVLKQVEENMNENIAEQLVNNNEVRFNYKETEYRLKRPSFSIKQKAYREKIRKFTELLKKGDLLLEKDLREVLKEKGISIEEMEDRIIKLESEKKDYQLKLGQMIKEGRAESDQEVLKNKIGEIEEAQRINSVEKTSYLQASLEHQLNMYIYSFFIVELTEKSTKGDKFTRLWKSIEDFENHTDEKFLNMVSLYAGLVVREEVGF